MKRLFFIAVLALVSLVARADFAEQSLYNIEGDFVDQNGNTTTLAALKDHKLIVSLVYLSCQYFCPMVITDIERIEKQLPAGTDVKIALITFDPANDSPEKMKAYLAKRKLDTRRWVALAPTSDSTLRQLTGVLNFRFKKIEGGGYSHSYTIVGLDEQGVMKVQMLGTNKDSTPMVNFLTGKPL